MAYAFVSKGDFAASGSALTVAVASVVVAANDYLFIRAICGNSGFTASCADGTNTYTQLGTGTVDTNGPATYFDFYCKAPAAGTYTITVTYSGSVAFRSVAYIRYSGLDNTAAPATAVQFQSSPGTGANAITSGTATPAAQPALVLGNTADYTSGTPPVYSVGTGFTSQGNMVNSDANFGGPSLWEDKRVTSTAAVAATFTGSVAASHEVPRAWIVPEASTGTNVALTGQAATGSVGTLTPADSVPLTGQVATASVGNLGPSQSITGQAATASAGTLTPTESVALTGSQATVSVGFLTAANAEALSGQAATTGQGTQTPVFNVPLSGQQITASLGTLTVLGDATAALTGTALTMSLGNLGVQNDGIVAQAQQLGGLGEWHHRKHREPSIEEWAEFAEYRDALRQARQELEKPKPSVAKVERAIEVLVTPTFEVPEYETRLEDLRNLAQVVEVSKRFQRIVGEYLAMLQDEEDVEILLH